MAAAIVIRDIADNLDDWLFSEERHEATLEQMEVKWTSVCSETEELCA